MANTNKNPLCINELQVHSIVKEAPNVTTINFIAQDFYPYQAGQYALVSIKNTPHITRAYSLSSTPGESRFVSITVREIEGGVGSTWLNNDVKVGDQVWFSNPMGEFSCQQVIADNYLLVGAGSGVTPIMSMARWLLANRPEVNVTVIHSVHSPEDVIFKQEWAELKAKYPKLQLVINASVNATEGFASGRISAEIIKNAVPNLANYTVMTCGPEAYMNALKEIVLSLGGTEDRFFTEAFFNTALAGEISSDKKTSLTINGISQIKAEVPVGMTLLAALEAQEQPVVSGCRTGLCGLCKTKVTSGEYEVVNTGDLTDEEIAQGYVLACSCRVKENVSVTL
ncbi:NADH oxidoreductase [Actinobacillus minor]|uniref:HCP oxidoreductase, NADH-dependent n=1 Tax=Actinobacillus minor NM305 TaxID=637911 RepID=C5S414_9PAST|nr:NADH oxidoreductase [Actinobacillus minor]EER46336.1 HCP oxidoreductase, NADH-dependent [Actinobacillus minor NM305]MDD6909602.1 NADH oxidoreductase [Actinobacillus minor]MDY4712664.1 NADH oxidoreductase [Actinobacillus minor]